MSEEKSVSGMGPVYERIEALFDVGSFVEIDKYLERSNAVGNYPDVSAPGEGVVAGWGTIGGRSAYVAAQNYAVLKGSFSVAHAQKICKVIDMAAKNGLPVVFLWDSGGARVQEGAAAMGAYSAVMKKLADVSGVVPTISVALGEMYGSAAMLATLTDFAIAAEDSARIGLISPMVKAAALGETVNEEKLSGAANAAKRGDISLLAQDAESAMELAKKLLGYLPLNNLEEAPFVDSGDPAARPIVSDGADVRALLTEVSDDQAFLELGKEFAPEMVTGFIMLDGFAAGVVANVPGEHLSAHGCKKAARFVRLMDAYDIPVVTIVDNEGIDAAAESCCMLRSLAQLAYAYGEAGCPMVSILKKAIGEGYTAFANKQNGADLVYAYEDSQIGCLTAEAGSIIFYDGAKSRAGEYAEEFLSALSAAKQGIVDDIIAPAQLRSTLIRAIEVVSNKREPKLQKKHGVMPL